VPGQTAIRWRRVNDLNWPPLKSLYSWLKIEAQDTEQQEFRIRSMERNVVLPIKTVVLAILVYYLYFTNWFEDETMIGPRDFLVELIQRFFLFYVAVSVAVGSFLLGMSQLPLRLIQMAVFLMGVIDAFFLSGLLLVTGGIDSILFWFFPALIVRNAISVPVAPLQLSLNCLTSLFYVCSGIQDIALGQKEVEFFDWQVVEALQPPEWATATEPLMIRLLLLLLISVCCFGVQVLFDKKRRAEEEAREFALRQEQLRVSGRLAGEIAHRLKNPLGIINNAAFNLQRNLREGKATITQQIRIIREEVDRSDRIITDLMGYARLAEGRIEKLSINDELDTALAQVFPPNEFDVTLERHYALGLPSLLMQKSHLSEILINLLFNARQAMEGRGHIMATTRYENSSLVIDLSDNGPGIPLELQEKIFEPYFTTKEKGSGLGLAIVKHNTEIYDGTVSMQSELGKGTTFTLRFPVRSLMKLRR